MFSKQDKAQMMKKVSNLAPQKQQKKSGSRFWSVASGAVVGAVAMFFLDPRGGNRRRAMVRDKVAHAGNVVSDTVPQKVGSVSNMAKGVQQAASSRVGGSHASDDDKTVTDRVMSEVFRDPQLPKGEVNVNTVDHVVYLRGHIEDPTKVEEIEERTRQVPGVKDVINLINRPDIDPSVVREEMEQSNESSSS